ncbi:MAG TPA: hypothetical protein VNE42_01455 [Acidimicrobiales bacterium]|nr:hypothetical protein [Acidimicrobiales bacterium]
MATLDSDIKSLVPRFRFGNILPTKDDLHRGANYQLYRVVPLDVMEISVGLGITDYTNDKVEEAMGNFEDCIARLKAEHVDRIILAGAPISAQLGRPRVLELLDRIQQEVGVPGDAPLEAAIAAMNGLGMSRLAIGSRWTSELNNKLIEYFKLGGIDVVFVSDRGQWAREAFGMSFEEGLEKAVEVGREAASNPEGEAVYVAGGAAMSLHAVPKVEAEFGKPVFTNMTAEVWNGLVHPGVIDPVEGWGRLLGMR